jgi:hypothetical protein
VLHRRPHCSLSVVSLLQCRSHPSLVWLCTAHAHSPICTHSRDQNSANARTPASSATPSRLYHRTLFSATGSTVQTTLVDYTCHGRAPRPNPSLIHLGNVEIEELRPCATAGLVAGDRRHHPACLNPVSCPIRSWHPRLDLNPRG